jgi:hypothetical protein
MDEEPSFPQKAPQVLWKRSKEKIDKVALAVALMERGEFDFSDGKKRWTVDEDGNRVPRIVQGEALVYGGYAPVSNAANFIFRYGDKHPYRKYLLERLDFHRRRLEGGFAKQLAEITDGGDALRQLSAKSYEVLMAQLSDPEASEKIKPADLIKLYVESTKLEASIKGDQSTRHVSQRAPAVMNVINLPEGYTPKGHDDYVKAEDAIDAEAEEC